MKSTREILQEIESCQNQLEDIEAWVKKAFANYIAHVNARSYESHNSSTQSFGLGDFGGETRTAEEEAHILRTRIKALSWVLE
jgi:hypothetical protein